MERKRCKIIQILPTQQEVLIYLNSNTRKINISKLHFESKMTYSHLVKSLSKLKNKGIINQEKKGREKLITLSKLGIEVASHLSSIEDLLIKNMKGGE